MPKQKLTLESLQNQINELQTEVHIEENKLKKILGKEITLYHIIATIVVALFIVLILRLNFHFFRNHGYSMLPSLNPEELLVINRSAYFFTEPKRGEFIIFYHPKDLNISYVKRIIGLPGETVEIRKGKIHISNLDNPQGFALNESYLDTDKQYTRGLINKTSQVLGKGEYYVLGDNRSESEDSRFFGPIHTSLIKGKVIYKIWWPYPLKTPEY